MEVLARFNGVHGEISIIQEIRTGARVYHEAGVYQSYVFPGGRAGLSYIRLMRKLLLQGSNALLLGCGGGTLFCEQSGEVALKANMEITVFTRAK